MIPQHKKHANFDLYLYIGGVNLGLCDAHKHFMTVQTQRSSSWQCIITKYQRHLLTLKGNMVLLIFVNKLTKNSYFFITIWIYKHLCLWSKRTTVNNFGCETFINHSLSYLVRLVCQIGRSHALICIDKCSFTYIKRIMPVLAMA